MRIIKYLASLILSVIIISCSGNKDNVDKMLESYEEYVTEYLSYMEKAKSGDMSTLSKYPELLKKAQELSSQIEECKGEMTAEQWNRFNEITAKMIDTPKVE